LKLMTQEERELLILIAEVANEALMRLATERHILSGNDEAVEPLLKKICQIKTAVNRLRSAYSLPGG